MRDGLSAKTLQEDLPNHHEVLPFQEDCAERHGKGKEVSFYQTDFIRYRLLETNEQRLNHRRGVVNNYIIGQKQVFGRVPAIRILNYLYFGYSANRHKDGVNFSLGLVTEQEKLLS